MIKRHGNRAALAAALVLSIAGCGAGGSDSPMASLETLKSALRAKDYKAAFAQMTPDCQNTMLGMCGISLGQESLLDSAEAPEARRLMEKFNIKVPLAMQKAFVTSKSAASCQQIPLSEDLFAEVLVDVKDKPACFAEIYVCSQRDSSFNNELANSQVSDLKLDADKATGILKLESPIMSSYPVYFEKIRGRWLVDVVSGVFVQMSQSSN